jgi:hypothetical protein
MKAKDMFEAIMKSKGHTDFSMTKNRYTNASMQTRWVYFQLGWEMREVSA